MKALGLVLAVAWWLGAGQARAIIVFGSNETDNLANPGIGAPWDAVVLIAKPSQAFNASAVYLGDGFFLTANHVDAVATGAQVRINGTLYSLDTSYDVDGIKVPVSGVDLKVFRVLSPPALPPVTLNANATADLQAVSYLIGGGVGKGAETLSQGWAWGAVATTSVKRWGLNLTLNAADSAALSGLLGYSALGTVFFSGYGNETGTVTLGDSGGGLFQFIGGQWVLSGLATTVEVLGSSFYNRGPTIPPNPDWAGYVRISAYASDILSAIPEPSTVALVVTGASLTLLGRRRKRL